MSTWLGDQFYHRHGGFQERAEHMEALIANEAKVEDHRRLGPMYEKLYELAGHVYGAENGQADGGKPELVRLLKGVVAAGGRAILAIEEG